MSDAKTRARSILRALPLARREREFYDEGVDKMEEGRLEETTRDLEAVLAQVPQVLEEARKLLKDQQAQSPRPAAIVFGDEAYREFLTRNFGEKLEIRTSNTPEDAIQMIGQTSPSIVICDLKMPRVKGINIIRRMRRAASAPCTILVLTTTPEEDAQVAAVGATGYAASNTVAELMRVVTNAIQAITSLSDKV
jgi:CheY-like chemotaxis protein